MGYEIIRKALPCGYLNNFEKKLRVLKRVSFFCNSLRIFVLCLIIDKLHKIIRNAAISLGRFKNIAMTGRHIEDITEASDTMPVGMNIISHKKIMLITTQTKRSIMIANAISAPKLVAMPLPPLNPKNIVQLWPLTVVIAQRHKNRFSEISAPL